MFFSPFSSIYHYYHLLFSYHDDDDDTIEKKERKEKKPSRCDENIQLTTVMMITNTIYQHDRL